MISTAFTLELLAIDLAYVLGMSVPKEIAIMLEEMARSMRLLCMADLGDWFAEKIKAAISLEIGIALTETEYDPFAAED